MTKYNYGDIVKLLDGDLSRIGHIAWIVGVFKFRVGTFFDKFPEGTVYSIEFEDGDSVEVHELQLEMVDKTPD